MNKKSVAHFCAVCLMALLGAYVGYHCNGSDKNEMAEESNGVSVSENESNTTTEEENPYVAYCGTHKEDDPFYEDTEFFGKPDTSSAQAYIASVERSIEKAVNFYDKNYSDGKASVDRKIDKVITYREHITDSVSCLGRNLDFISASYVNQDIVEFRIARAYYNRLSKCISAAEKDSLWDDMIGFYRFEADSEQFRGELASLGTYDVGSGTMSAFYEVEMSACVKYWWCEELKKGHDSTHDMTDGDKDQFIAKILGVSVLTGDFSEYMSEDRQKEFSDMRKGCKKSIKAFRPCLDRWCPSKASSKRLLKMLEEYSCGG